MNISLLRRRRGDPQTSSTTGTTPALRPALSLPDLTSPLLDPASWVELAPAYPTALNTAVANTNVAHSAIGTNSPRGQSGSRQATTVAAIRAGTATSPTYSDSATPRGRAPSLVRDPTGSPPQFHRPFTPWQVVPDIFSTPTIPGRGRGHGQESGIGQGQGRTRGEIYTALARSRSTRRGGKRKESAPLTVLILGSIGSGKTSFINALASQIDPSYRGTNQTKPTTGIVRSQVLASDKSGERPIVLLDTPGLPPVIDLPSRTTRNRAMSAVVRIVENRLERVLAEENKVVRRKLDGSELIHLVIYLIDARKLLVRPSPAEIDWATLQEPAPHASFVGSGSGKADADADDEETTVGTAVMARLDSAEIETIQKLASCANLMPVLTHSDALTSAELAKVRAAVRSDLTDGSLPDGLPGREIFGQWGMLRDNDEEINEFDEGDEFDSDDGGCDGAKGTNGTGHTSSIVQRSPSSSSPASGLGSSMSVAAGSGDRADSCSLPFSVFAPESGCSSRTYPWGDADMTASSHNDLIRVKAALIGAAEWLRSYSHEVRYERFRTEKLVARGGGVRVE